MASTDPLERPVWATLCGAHVAFSEGGALAKRFRPDVNVFASARDDSGEAGAALAALVAPGEAVGILQVPPIAVPEGFDVLRVRDGVQMTAASAIEPPKDPRIKPLGAGDAEEMLALATLTEPGPFARNTYQMGRFVGMRIEGRLAAMAGERMIRRWYSEPSFSSLV